MNYRIEGGRREATQVGGPHFLGVPALYLASRKGIEPLTPGLGNLCSIRLSYRDAAEGSRLQGAVWTKAPRTGKSVSMDLRAAHASLRRFGRLCAGGAALAAMVVASLAASDPARAACGTSHGTVRVVDLDDRLNLVLADGRTVRLGGVAPPDPARAPELALAARGLLASRVVGREGELERLVSGTDRWGRVVADILFSDRDPDGVGGSAAAILLAAGYGRVAPDFEARGCVAERLRIEDAARSHGLGLWSDLSASVIEATDGEALRRNSGRLVVIEGRVRRVGFGRSRLYLDMVRKGGPTVVVPRKLEPAFARAGHSLDAAAGQTIRVRGALENRLGPRLEVSDPAMIEFLGRSGAPVVDKPNP